MPHYCLSFADSAFVDGITGAPEFGTAYGYKGGYGVRINNASAAEDFDVRLSLDGFGQWVQVFYDQASILVRFTLKAAPAANRGILGFYRGTFQLWAGINTDRTMFIGSTNGAYALTIDTTYVLAIKYDSDADSHQLKIYSADMATLHETITDTTAILDAYQVFWGNGSDATLDYWLSDMHWQVDDVAVTYPLLVSDYQVHAAPPTGNGTDTAWTGDYTAVDEIPSDTGDYISTTGLTMDETFTFAALGAQTIYLVQIRNRIGESLASGSSGHAARVRSGATVQESTALDFGTGSTDFAWAMTTDPDTASAWTPAGRNAAEYGVGSDTDITPNELRCFSFLLETVYLASVNATVTVTAGEVAFAGQSVTITSGAPISILNYGFGDSPSTYNTEVQLKLEPHIVVYDNITDMIPVAYLSDGVTVEELTTQLHGGFGQLSFKFGATWLDALTWFKERFFCPVIAKDQYGTTFFEGRIEDVTLGISKDGTEVSILALGFWRSCMDIPHNEYHSASPGYVGAWTFTRVGINSSDHSDDDEIGIDFNTSLVVGDTGRLILTTPRPFAGYIKEFKFTWNYGAGGNNHDNRLFAVNSATTWPGDGYPPSAGYEEYTGGDLDASSGDRTFTVSGTNYDQLCFYTEVTGGGTNGFNTAATNLDVRTQVGRDSSDILKRILTKSCPSISSDQSNIIDTNYELKFPVNYDDDKYPYEIITDLCEFGNSDNKLVWFAIWEGRVAYLMAQRTEIIYDAPIDNVDATLTASMRDFRSRVYGKYTLVAGTTARTATVTDSTAEAAHIRRDYCVSVSVTAATDANRLAEAERIRDLYEAEYDQHSLEGDITITSHLLDRAGSPVPLWRVRAGDTVRLPWLETSVVTAVDGISAFHVIRTAYSPEENTLTISPTGPSRALDIEIARLALPS